GRCARSHRRSRASRGSRVWTTTRARSRRALKNKERAMGRSAKTERNTKETQIAAELELDGGGSAQIETGIPFFNHMLEIFTRHGLFDIKIRAKGDIEVDYHHT